MKPILTLLLPLLFLIAPVHAHAQTDTLRTSLRKGAKALQFRVTPNLTLGSFDGATFSGKWHLSDRKALRIGVDLSGSFTNSEMSTVRQLMNTSGEESIDGTEVDRELSSFFVSIRSYFMAYPNPGEAINFYTGIGPFVSWNVGDEDENSVRTLPSDDSVFEDQTSDDTRFSAGLGFVLGLEWFVNTRMSLTAEYLVSAFYSTFNRDINTVETNSADDARRTTEFEDSNSQIRIAGNGARLGLSIYF